MSDRVEIRQGSRVEIRVPGPAATQVATSTRTQVRDGGGDRVDVRPQQRTQVADAGVVGPRGPSGGVASAIAAVDLSGHRVITTDDTGLAIYADSTTTEDVGGPFWLSIAAVMAGQVGAFVVLGEVVEPSWAWVDDGAIFLSANGVLTQTPPLSGAFLLRVAAPTSPTSLFFDPQLPIEL